MALQFDKDERAVTAKIREFAPIFNEIGNEFKIVSFRGDIAELMLDARIDALVTHEGWKRDKAEEAVLADLEKSKA